MSIELLDGEVMKITKGDTKEFHIILYDKDGALFDLNGYTMVFTARSSYASPTIAIEATAIISAPLTGRGDFEIPKADTDILEGSYVYDIQIDSTIKRYTIRRTQKLTITPEVTQPAP